MLRRGGYEGSSFFDFLKLEHSHLLPDFALDIAAGRELIEQALKGTTILALKFNQGAIIAGDRRATEGHQIAGRYLEKVYKADEHSAIAMAGAAGPCLEVARLFQVELEHYEKLEGVELSLEGKANKLSQMIRANLPLAIQGLVVIPIFVGYDLTKGEGKIYKYDVTGGRYEEREYYATGSGGVTARNSMKKLYRKGLERKEALRVALEALYDAADEDAGTAPPDLVKDIFPTTRLITKEGFEAASDAESKQIFLEIIDERKAA